MLVCLEQSDEGGLPSKSGDSGQTPNEVKLTRQYLLFSTLRRLEKQEDVAIVVCFPKHHSFSWGLSSYIIPKADSGARTLALTPGPGFRRVHSEPSDLLVLFIYPRGLEWRLVPNPKWHFDLDPISNSDSGESFNFWIPHCGNNSWKKVLCCLCNCAESMTQHM